MSVAYKWVPCMQNQMTVPMGAVLAGNDADGAEVYVGRASHEGDSVCAKVIPSKNVCFVPHGGGEHYKDIYDVLVPAMFQWIPAANGEVPDGAVDVGVTAAGDKIYMGRVTDDDVTTPGRVEPDHGVCYYALDGEEKSSDTYEVLVLN